MSALPESKMHIAHMIDTLEWGGAQKLEVNFAEVAQARGQPFTVIGLRYNDDSPFPAELRARGARVVIFPGPKLFDPPRLGRLVRFLHQEHFDILHTHLTTANILGPLTGALTGTPVVSTLHLAAYDATSPRERLETWTLKYGARRVIAVGQGVAEAQRARFAPRVVDVIPNGIIPAARPSDDARAALRAQLLGDSPGPLLIAVGRLHAQKGYGDLIDAFAELRKTHPMAGLVIVGGGECQAELEARIASLGLTGHARLLGARNDVAQLLAASDIYVSSSHCEGLPLTLLEAMAVGLPIVTTGVGDVPNVVVDGTGVIVPAHNPTALAEAVSALLQDPARRRALGAAAQVRFSTNYGVLTWFERHLTLYVQVCAH